jgi:glycosyltransferase involved in cell wall biosynthesis
LSEAREGVGPRFLVPPLQSAITGSIAPTFAVIIPAYQAADTIGEAVASALAQTRPAEEIIVCDDGSTDDLEHSLAPYVDRIVLLRRPHRGAANAKNEGVSTASTEFVTVLDADDVFMPERLAALAELAGARPDLDILATDSSVDVEGHTVGCWSERERFEISDQRAAILERCFLLQHSAVRRTALLAVGGFDAATEPAEDWDAWIRLILAGSRAGLVEESLARYRLREGSFTSNRPRALRGRVAALEKAKTNPSLTERERVIATRSHARQLQRALLVEAEESLRSRRPDARRRAFTLAFAPGSPLAVRLKAVGATLAPRTAAALLARREDSTRRRVDSKAEADT